MVHRDCMVYMALPSPSRQSTLRSGQAIAAPTAAGSPQPIAAAGQVEPVVGLGRGSGGIQYKAGGDGLINDHRIFRHEMRHRRRHLGYIQRP